MKKKIKDLTAQERKKICATYHCNECPINPMSFGFSYKLCNCYLPSNENNQVFTNIEKEYMEKEIEINENID